MNKTILNGKVVVSILTLVAAAACSSTGDSMRGAISTVIQPTDWTDRVCESPIYKEMIGTYSGEMSVIAGGRSCRWSATLSVAGQNSGRDCNLTGHVETLLIDQGSVVESSPYACASGKSEVIFTSGLGVGDDLDTLRPVSLGITFPSTLNERDTSGLELVHPIRQFEHMTVEYQGLMTDNRALLARQ